jgi:cobalamin biosynthesis protein CobT
MGNGTSAGEAGEGGEGGTAEVECPSDCTNRAPMKYGRPLGVNEQSADAKKAKASGKSEELRKVDNKELLQGGNTEGENIIETNRVADSFMEQDTRQTERSLADLLEQRAKDIRSNDDVKREVREFREAVASNDEHRNSVRVARYTNMTPTEVNAQGGRNGDYPLIAEQFGRELERLEIDNEPNWDKEKPSGRLNVQRTMNAGLNDIDRLFDQWSEVDYGTEIEAVILLDNSGSMGGRIQRASASVWAIKRGLERIYANTTVFSFNSGSRVLYASDEKTTFDVIRTVHAGGTTNPVRALEEAKQIFNLTNRTTKLLFIITDGGFDYAEPCDNLIKQFNEDGVITSTIFLGYIDSDSYVYKAENIEGFRHYAKHFNVVVDPADLVRVATDIVVEQLGVHQ